MLRSLLPLVFFIALSLVPISRVFAQDPQYSQYYAAPLYLNPAFAGAELMGRVGFNYRNQWPSIEAQFTTFSAYYDTYLPEYNSGIGVHVMQDSEGASKLRSTSVSAMYSYELRLADKLYFRPGFQASYIRREIGFYENLVFANQINPLDPTGPLLPGAAIPGLGDPVGLFSLSAGGLLFTNNAWIGFCTPSQPTEPIFCGRVEPLAKEVIPSCGLPNFVGTRQHAEGFYPHEQAALLDSNHQLQKARTL